MRLLNTKTHELHDFFEGQIPDYVILSHRWGADEATYKDFRKGRNKDGAGHKKIVAFCAFARSRTWEWIWVDTCCIDKRSSAELSEAINSMWRWYANARECYAYLVDVPALAHGRESVIRRLRMSDWFNRSWTLQELLAPPAFVFCNSAWEIVGSRDVLSAEVSAVTGIPERYVRHFTPESAAGHSTGVSVAEKMSWASKRQCTRAEDQAYSLLGLFGVNMPLLYGERWQERVQKTTARDRQLVRRRVHLRLVRLAQHAHIRIDNVRLFPYCIRGSGQCPDNLVQRDVQHRLHTRPGAPITLCHDEQRAEYPGQSSASYQKPAHCADARVVLDVPQLH